MKSSMDQLQAEVGEWANVTFGRANDPSAMRKVANHLEDEVIELSALRLERPLSTWECGHVQEEAADCALLLFHLAHLGEFSLEGAVRAKFERNKARQWGEPDARGVITHVRDSNDG